MKGYISSFDKRGQLLKKIFIENGYEIVDFKDNLDFYYLTSEKKPDAKYVFTLNNKGNYIINQNPIFRHLNNTLTVAAFFLETKTLFIHKKILILGYGDLAKQLIKILEKENDITIANRNYKDLDTIQNKYRHMDIHLLTGCYDFVINTIPDIDIDYSDVKYQKIFDLANTVSMKNYVSLRNLPNIYFPYESALLIFYYIKDVLEHD